MGIDPRALDPGRPRPGASPWLWLLALVPAGAWFVHLNISYLLVPPSCGAGHRGWLLAVTVPPIAITVAAIWLSHRAWTNEQRSAPDRTAGAAGILLGCLFLLVIVVIGLANALVDPCR